MIQYTADDVVLIRSRDEGEKGDEGKDSEVDEEIVVTGSRIARNASEVAANIVVLDAQDLKATGETTLQGALRRLPQNVNGASEVAPFFSNEGYNGAVNLTGGSSINLRGLGSESTLVLVDGRRIGKSGLFGGVSDINGIPLKSVERVEIMLDGASAVYGADAVGGVVNIILKKNYDGASASYNYGKPEEGGFEEHQLTLSGTYSWDGGRVLVDFERFQRSNLDGGERPNIKVIRNTESQSGLVNPASLSGVLFYRYNDQNYLPSQLTALGVSPSDPGVQAIRTFLVPDTQTGTTIDLNSITAFSELRFNHFLIPPQPNDGVSLIADQEFDSLRVRVEQKVTDTINVGANLYYSERNTYAARGAFNGRIRTAPGQAGNPFEVDTTIEFSLPAGFADRHNETNQKAFRWNVYANGNLWETWDWEVSVAQSVDTISSLEFNRADGLAARELVAAGSLQLYTGNPFGDNSPEVLRQWAAPTSDSQSRNEEPVIDFRADGELFDISGGAVRLALGGEWRQESLKSSSAIRVVQIFGGANNFSLPLGAYDTEGLEVIPSRQQRSAFAELLFPVVGSDNALPGIEQLTITGAGRYDSYSTNAGSESTWSLGVVWTPVEEVNVKLRKSTAFVAPTYRDQLIPSNDLDFTFGGLLPGAPRNVVDAAGNVVGREYIAVITLGGKPELLPETAVSSSAIVEYTPDFLPGLSLSVGWHETTYSNRLTAPPLSVEFPVEAGDYVALFPHITRIPAGQPNEGSLYADQRAINASFWYQSGVDYRLHYSRSTDFGEFYMTGNVATTSNFEVQLFPNNPLEDRVERSTAFSLVPARRYNVDFGWNHRGVSAYLSANTSSKVYHINEFSASDVVRITDSAVQTNLTVSYDTGSGDLFAVPEWLSDTTLSFRVTNVLNDYSETLVYTDGVLDPTQVFFRGPQTDPRGRMFNFELSKQF